MFEKIIRRIALNYLMKQDMNARGFIREREEIISKRYTKEAFEDLKKESDIIGRAWVLLHNVEYTEKHTRIQYCNAQPATKIEE